MEETSGEVSIQLKQRHNQHQRTQFFGHGAHRLNVNFRDIWSNTCLWEILSIVLSGIAFTLIIILLKTYDQHPPPQFSYGLTLNALTSVLASFSKSSLLVAVAGAISQLKWHWFQSTDGRSVFDMQLFDDASRGPWGSVMLLSTAHSWSLASMGALVSIWALAIDPFTQQLITYPSRNVVSSNPASQAHDIYRAKSYVAVEDLNRDNLDVHYRVMASLWDLASEAEGFAAVQCPTGNCTWDEFESLAFCTTCQSTSNIVVSNSSLFWNASIA
jgi:hypothetical protein